jgi:thioesterase domain-containing protein
LKSRSIDPEQSSAPAEDELRARIAALSPEKVRLLSGEIRKTKGNVPLARTDAVSPSYLIAIRRTGAKRPLFLADPSTGSAKAYSTLAKYLDAEQPLYGFQRLVLGSHEAPPYLPIERLAANYVNAMQTIQAQGPYLIGGYSMGGVIAFEMALQLKARGQQVDLIAMIDSAAPSGLTSDNSEPRPFIDDLIMIGTILASDKGEEFNLSPAALEPLSPDERLSRFAQQIWEQKLTPVYMDEQVWRAATTILQNSFRALRDYTPREYDGSVVLINAQDSTEGERGLYNNPTLGWDAFCAKPIGVHYAPGDHIRVMTEPYIRTVGAVLQRSLDHHQ